MDIRILTLLVLISVAGSMADLRSPLLRIRRNGLQESGKSRVVEFVGMPRAKRDSPTAESTAKTTATPTSTSDPPATASAALSTTPAMKKPDPTTRSTPNSYPTTSSTPDSSSTTPKPRPSTGSTAATSTVSPKATTATTTTSATSKKPADSGKSKKPGSSTAPPTLGSRIDPSMDEPEESDKKPEPKPDAQPGPSQGTASFLGFQNPHPVVPPFFMPSFVPDVAFPYNPYGDPTFNSIPGPNNYAWTGTNNGAGAASSFASASAGGFGSSGYDKTPSVGDRGAFVDNTPSVSNFPGASNMPNVVSAGGYDNNRGGTGFEPNSFVFPGYNLDAFQRQMEDHFRQLQAQFQQQQQSLFETANRIGTDGYSGGGSNPGVHSAVSSIGLGPGGGYQAGAINPAAPGIASRFSDDLPAPSGNSYGVFAGSSSKTVVGPDGKPVSHKISTTGVNDNGKITFRTVQD